MKPKICFEEATRQNKRFPCESSLELAAGRQKRVFLSLVRFFLFASHQKERNEHNKNQIKT